MIRTANEADTDTIASMLGPLVAQHVAYDRARFVTPADIVSVCAGWLRRAETEDAVLFLLAHSVERAHGYVIAETFPAEPESWSGPHAIIHDLYVDPRERRSGVAHELVNAVCEWARGRGIVQVRAGVAAANRLAQQFFEIEGFRATIMEMTLDIG
jgi:GNAT superfamily N-acetyltransferase